MSGLRAGAVLWLALAAGLSGCGWANTPSCPDDATVLARSEAGSLTCGDAEDVRLWLTMLAGRPVVGESRDRVRRGLRDGLAADAAGTLAMVAAVRREGAALQASTNLQGAELRSRAVWQAGAGKGPIQERHGDLWNLQNASLSVWARDDETQLALTEADIEAWIHFSSLCREIQQAGPLRMSVADRVPVYTLVQERFDESDRFSQIALSSMGVLWPAVYEGWKAAPAEAQQAYIRSATLPPPMTATSLGYVEGVLALEPIEVVSVAQKHFGPAPVNRGEARFAAAAAAP